MSKDTLSAVGQQFSHYHKNVENLKTIDIYRVIQLWGITDPCLQHALKKVMVAGGRGAKAIEKDVAEAIASLQRWQEMRAEVTPPVKPAGPLLDPLVQGVLTGRIGSASRMEPPPAVPRNG